MTKLLLILAATTAQIEVVDHTSPAPCLGVVVHTVPAKSLEVVVHIPQPAKTKRNVGYPVRMAGKFWYDGGYWPQARHLNEGEHLGLFDVDWLNSLTPQHLLNLHSDAHEGHVNWETAFRPGEYKAPAVASPTRQRWVQRCINGRCHFTLEWY